MADEPAVVLTEYRVIFALPGTPPRRIRATSVGEDEDMPGMIAFFDRDDSPFFWVPRDHVLFVDRRGFRDRDDRDDLDEADEQPRRAATAAAGMARIAAGQPDR
jgi:hypothetical protein